MATTETDETATTVQPTISTNSVVDPAITIIEPDTQKVTEISGQTTTKAEPTDALVNDPIETGIAKPITVEGEPNGLPPAAPTVQLQPPAEVKALREWEHQYLRVSIHSKDEAHLHALHQHIEAMCAKLHSKYPAQS
jgi:hypothetical protein